MRRSCFSHKNRTTQRNLRPTAQCLCGLILLFDFDAMWVQHGTGGGAVGRRGPVPIGWQLSDLLRRTVDILTSLRGTVFLLRPDNNVVFPKMSKQLWGPKQPPLQWIL